MDKTPKMAGPQPKNQNIPAARTGFWSRFRLNRPAVNLATMTTRQRTRYERERLLTRLLLITVGGVLFLIVALIAFGYYSTIIRPAQEPIVTINGQPISTETYARIFGYEQTNLLNEYQQTQAQLQQMQSAGQSQDNAMLMQLLQQQQQQLQGQLQGLQQSVLNRIIDATLLRQEAARRNITASDAEVHDQLVSMLSPATPTPESSSPATTPEATVTGTVQVQPAASGTPEGTPATPAAQTPATTATTATGVATPAATASSSAAVTATGTTSTPVAALTPTEPVPTPTPVDPKKLVDDFSSQLQSNGMLSEADYLYWYVQPEVLRKKLEPVFAEQAPTSGDQVKASMIEVYSDDDAKSVMAKLKSGADFAEVAKESSQDTASKDKGGELGWFPRGLQPDIPKVVEDATFDKLQVGQVSDVLHGDNNILYIVKLEDKASNRPYDPDVLKKVKDNMLNTWLQQQAANTGAGKTVSYNLSSERDDWVRKFIDRNTKK